MNCTMTLVDIDEIYCGQALKRLELSFPPMATWVHSDLSNRQSDYDTIIANHVLYYVPDMNLSMPAVATASQCLRTK